METCDAMKGLIAEGSEIIDLEGEPDVKDAALIAAAQRVEHYEIAGYGWYGVRRRLGRENVAQVLQQTLDEEANADKILSHTRRTSLMCMRRTTRSTCSSIGLLPSLPARFLPQGERGWR